MLRSLRFLTVTFLFLLTFSASLIAQSNVLFIVDASGSMKEKIDGKTRMEVAKKVLSDTLGDMPDEVRLGLLVYGHRTAKDCTDIELIAPIGGDDANGISKVIKELNAKGETPIAESLRRAAKSFKVFKGQENKIILVTDGLEECKGDPCAAAKELKDAGLNVAVNIVGFTIDEEDAKKLRCVTETTGGKYYSAANAKALTEVLKEMQAEVQKTVVVQEAKTATFDGDLLAKKNGGKLEYAPNDAWLRLNNNHKDFNGATYAGEAVWSFKDGKAAKFEQIEVLVPKAYQYNIKDFEVLVADDLSGPYRSLGEFAAHNMKMMPEGWQGFKFPETTARYIKVVFKTAQGGSYIRGNALRLVGSIIKDSASAENLAPASGIDVLSQKNGGTLVSAPNSKWSLLNGKVKDFKGPTRAGAGVWSFKDGKAAKFMQIEVQVSKTYQYNLKNFEVFASDEVSGPFRSLGEFTVANHKAMPDGWQAFSFPETTAKYVKISFNSDQGGGYIIGNPLRVIGIIDESSEATETATEIEGINLIAQKNDGALLMGTNDEWGKLNDGLSDQIGVAIYVGEGVWAFKDEKIAIIEAVGALLPSSYQYNLKDFEVLVGDDGPTGDFRSVGTFTTQNIKVLPGGWQMFRFPKTEAKYIKIKALTSHGSYIRANEFSVMGVLVE